MKVKITFTFTREFDLNPLDYIQGEDKTVSPPSKEEIIQMEKDAIAEDPGMFIQGPGDGTVTIEELSDDYEINKDQDSSEGA